MHKLSVQRRGRKNVCLRRRAPHGLTVVEVLLVLSVIFLNVAIFLPLVNSARESSRRSQCRNNLKQIGMAISQYEESHNSFPAGFEVSSSGNYLGWGWSIRILPHMNAPGTWQAIEPYLTKGIHGLPQSPAPQGERSPARGHQDRGDRRGVARRGAADSPRLSTR